MVEPSKAVQWIPRISLTFLLITAYFSVGFFQSDEHFQILEFAALKLGMISPELMPWEYTTQMRPTLQPLLALWIHKLFQLLHWEDPFVISGVLRILSALLSYLGMWSVYEFFRTRYSSSRNQDWFLFLSFLLWCNIFIGVRFSSEGWSGSLFLISLLVYNKLSHRRNLQFLTMGFIFGLAYLCRYQVGLMIFGFCLWLLFIKREKFSSLLVLTLGFSLVFGIGILIDRWFYGEWTLTVWNYLDQNIIHDKISDFGVDPWWNYLLQVFLALIPPFSLLVIIGYFFLIIRQPGNILVWTLLPFILVHMLIGHKELRFLFPLLGFVPAIVSESISLLNSRKKTDVLQRKWAKKVATAFMAINGLLLLFVATTSFDRTTPLYRYVYRHFPESTTIYYMGTDPYKLGHLSYYKRTNLTVKAIESLSELDRFSNQKILLVVDRPNKLNDVNADVQLLYSSIPGWVWYLNFNHWIERTLAWYLYEVTPGKVNSTHPQNR